MPFLQSIIIGVCSGLLLCTLSFSAECLAQEVMVEGQAPILNGDIGQAREQALNRALDLAAASGGTQTSLLTQSQPGSLPDDPLRPWATACAQNSRILAESVTDGQLHLNVAVKLVPGQQDCAPICQPGYTNKVVITGIAMAFPEQLQTGETSTLVHATAIELARKLQHGNRVLADHAETVFPYSSPARAPEPLLLPGDHETPFVSLAKSRRAQYVVSGVYRDFGIRRSYFILNARAMVIDIYIHDGANGTLLAQRRFSRVVEGDVKLRNVPAIGTEAFYRTNMGRVWGMLLDEIAFWTSEKTACLPLMARVLKIEGQKIFIDIGAEAGVATGNTLRLYTRKEPPVTTTTGLLLGQEKQSWRNLTFIAVYPGFSIAEPAEARFDPIRIRSGDLLYLQ